MRELQYWRAFQVIYLDSRTTLLLAAETVDFPNVIVDFSHLQALAAVA